MRGLLHTGFVVVTSLTLVFSVSEGLLSLQLLLLLATSGVIAVLLDVDPPITNDVVLAYVPWIAVAASLTALSQVVAVPTVVALLFGSPVVYVAVVVGTGLVWAFITTSEYGSSAWVGSQLFGLSGVFILAPVVGAIVILDGETIPLFWPVLSVFSALGITAVVWLVLVEQSPQRIAKTGLLGAFVIYGHVLDAVTTIIGVDVLGLVEGNALPNAILLFASGLPTARVFGTGWLFALLKILVILSVLWLVTDLFHERTGQQRLLLGLTATAGLGPGLHNVFLYFLL